MMMSPISFEALPYEIKSFILKKLNLKSAARMIQGSKAIEKMMGNFNQMAHCKSSLEIIEKKIIRLNQFIEMGEMRMEEARQNILAIDHQLGYNPLVWIWRERIEKNERLLEEAENDRKFVLNRISNGSWCINC